MKGRKKTRRLRRGESLNNFPLPRILALWRGTRSSPSSRVLAVLRDEHGCPFRTSARSNQGGLISHLRAKGSPASSDSPLDSSVMIIFDRSRDFAVGILGMMQSRTTRKERERNDGTGEYRGRGDSIHIFIFFAALPPPNDELERFDALFDSVGERSDSRCQRGATDRADRGMERRTYQF